MHWIPCCKLVPVSIVIVTWWYKKDLVYCRTESRLSWSLKCRHQVDQFIHGTSRYLLLAIIRWYKLALAAQRWTFVWRYKVWGPQKCVESQTGWTFLSRRTERAFNRIMLSWPHNRPRPSSAQRTSLGLSPTVPLDDMLAMMVICVLKD